MRRYILPLLIFEVVSCMQKEPTKQQKIELVDTVEHKVSNELVTKTKVTSSKELQPVFADIKKQLTPVAEIFEIIPSSDTIIFGVQGTEIIISENSLITDKEVVRLSINEAYYLSDFIRYNLMTISNNERLVSNGMVKLESLTPGVRINPKYPLKIKLTSNDTTACDLFLAKTDAKGDMNWIPQNQIYSPEQETLDRPLSSQPFPYNGFDRLTQTCLFTKNAYHSERKGEVKIKVKINLRGELENVELVEGIYPEIDKYIIQKIQKLELWVPKFQDEVAVNTTLELKINVKAIKSNFSDCQYELTYPEVFQGITEYPVHIKRWIDSHILKKVESALPKQKPKFSLLDGYIYDLDKFGWINCDYFKGRTRGKIRIRYEKGADYRILVHKAKSVLRPVLNGNIVLCEQVKKSEKYSIISLKKRGKELFYACEYIEKTHPKIIDLEYRNVTPEELDELLDDLDDY